MRALHTALLTGPYDWDPDLLPQSEFDARLAAVREVMAKNGLTALLVHGMTLDHGGLAYLTGFTPKLGPAYALITPTGAPRLLPSGSGTMLPSAQRLTWIADLQPYGDIAKPLGAFLTETASGGKIRLGLWGEESMTQRSYDAVVDAVAPHGALVPLDAAFDALRRRKSPAELAVLRRAAGIARQAAGVFARATAEGSGARTASLAAEAAAYAANAQDFRMLASARNGGPPWPFDTPDDRRIDPLLAVVMVRVAGYWAEVTVTVTTDPGVALAEAQQGLAAMVAAARPGTAGADLAKAAAAVRRSGAAHPATALGNAIGLSLEEGSIDAGTRLEAGGVYVLRNGVTGPSGEVAAVSAMIAVGADGAEVLDV